MHAYRLDRVSDADLLRRLATLVRQDRTITAALLAHMAEVDARRLYAPAGYASMHAYCVGELRLSEDAAGKRIQAARVGQKFPQVFEMLADGRLHLTGLNLLAPKLNAETAGELLAAATHKTKSEIEQLLAQRYPQTEALPLVCVIAGSTLVPAQHAPAHVHAIPGQHAGHAVGARTERAPAHVTAAPARVTPTAPERYTIQVTVSRETQEKLQQLRELLSHSGGELADALDYALRAGVEKAEKRRFGATDTPRRPRASADARTIPADVRRAVYARDRGRCTFVAGDGHRCESRSHLQFDHIQPVARGGGSNADNLRLRCRTHNQYEAERVFGAGFMHRMRGAARPMERSNAPGSA